MRAAFMLAWACGLLLPSIAVHANPPCSVPDDLAMHDLVLPAAKQSVMKKHRLTILTIGGAYTSGVAAGDQKYTYPVRLQADLIDALPGVEVTVVNTAHPNNTVEATVPQIPADIAASHAVLVIWAPGGHDAVRRLNLTEFFTNLEVGIDAVRRAGADLLLMDMQYVPMLEQWSRIEDYRDMLRGTADANDVPLVPRHELMRHWSDEGALNLDATDQAEQTLVTKALFACMAKALAAPIAEAVR